MHISKRAEQSSGAGRASRAGRQNSSVCHRWMFWAPEMHILKQAEQDGGGAGRADRADRAGRQNRQASNRGQDGTPLDKSSA